ncbi:MAG TPA: KOW motif-containing protein [Blastocatellia bacterium]|nr:KOW motif-containing protein [Blastocatellia bacterium]
MINVGSTVRVLSGRFAGKVGSVLRVESQKWHKGNLGRSDRLYTIVFPDGETVPFLEHLLEEARTRDLPKLPR